MGFRLRAIASVAGSALLAAGCGGDATSITIRTRVLAPSDRADDPFAGAASVRISVLQDGAVVGSRDFALADEWKIPDADADAGRPLQVRISGLDGAGNVVLDGRTRPVVPKTAGGKTYGVFVSPAGQFALPPAPMAEPRRQAGVLVLDDARVLVAGGEDSANVATTSIEIYDPDEGTWRTLVDLATARTFPTLAQLPDGRVLIAGGDDDAGTDLTSCELLTLPADASGTGSIAPAADLQSPARSQQAVRLPSGKVFVAGGFSDLGPPRPAVYDPVANTWSVPANGSRAAAASVARLSDGRVAVVGGSDVGGSLDRIDVFTENGASLDLVSGTLRVKRHGASALAVTVDGQEQILVTGGSTSPTADLHVAAVELVSLASGAPVSTLLERDTHHRGFRGIARLQGGSVLLAGGEGLTVSSAQAEVFDPASKRLEETSSMSDARRARFSTVSLPDGTAIVAGGDDSSAVDIYQPPAAPLTGATRLDVAISPVFGTRAGGGDPKEGGVTYRLRAWDLHSLVEERTFPASSATLTFPFKVGTGTTDDVYLTLELLDANGAAVSWGASAEIDAAEQAALTAMTMQLGRAGEFTMTAQMASARASSAAAPLADGRVIVAGGIGAPASTEIFDPASGTVAPGPAIPGAGHFDDFGIAVAGTDLYLTAGRSGAAAATATTATNILDLVTLAWRTPAPAPVPAQQRRHSMVVLASGDLFTYGGVNGVNAHQSLAFRRDAAAGTWAAVPIGTPDQRSEHDAVTLVNGDVLITGGITSAGTVALSATTTRWNGAAFLTAGTMQQARRNHCTAALADGRAVVCGGHATLAAGTMRDTCEVWNGTTGWTLLVDTLSAPRSEMARTVLADGRVMMIGGGVENAGVQGSTTAVDFLDLANLSLAAGPSLVESREEAVATTLPDGRVVVLGGQDDATNVERTSIEVYTPPGWRNPFGY